MKNLLIFLSTLTPLTASIGSVLSYKAINDIEITEQKSYSFNFANLNIKEDDFKNINGINVAIYENDLLKNALNKCVNELIDLIDYHQPIREYQINYIGTSFDDDRNQGLNNDVAGFNQVFKKLKKDCFSSHRLQIERYRDPNVNQYFYYLNLWATYKEENGENKDLRLWGIKSNKYYESIDTLNSEFKNIFSLWIRKEKNIEGEDKEPWDLEIPDDFPCLDINQIRGWIRKNKEIRRKIIERIYEIKKVQLSYFDEKIKIYKSIKNEDGTFSVGELIDKPDHKVTDSYFFIGVTCTKEVTGEYKVLIKNTTPD